MIKSVTGFEGIEEEVENDIQPWIRNVEYEGNFLDGKKNGFGRIVYPNGDIYKGQFSAD